MKRANVVIAVVFGLILLFAMSASAGPVLNRILQKGELVVGTTGNQPPLTAKTKEGKVIGLDADLARLMAADMGVEVKFVPMAFPELLPALEGGKVDMVLSSMTITPERNLKVAFVGPYFISGKGILTKIQTIASLQDAAGLNKPEFTLAALQNSTSQILVEKGLPKARLVTTKSYDEAVELLTQGKVDGVIADYPFCAVSAFRYREKGLVAGEARLSFEPLGVALPPNDSLLVNWVENYLYLLKDSGELRRLTDRWFKNASWLQELP